jgi:hypothetical protein
MKPLSTEAIYQVGCLALQLAANPDPPEDYVESIWAALSYEPTDIERKRVFDIVLEAMGDAQKVVQDSFAAALAKGTGPVGTKLLIPSVANEKENITIAWVVVRKLDEELSDSQQQLLLVPIDTCFFVGAGDVKLNEPWVARCGEGIWVSQTTVETFTWIDKIPLDELMVIRKRIGELARGQFVQDGDDDDPNYQDHMSSIKRIRAELE